MEAIHSKQPETPLCSYHPISSPSPCLSLLRQFLSPTARALLRSSSSVAPNISVGSDGELVRGSDDGDQAWRRWGRICGLGWMEQFYGVESNLNKIEEHHRKYECLRKEKELRKIELQVQRQILQESESASVLEDGQVIEIRSFIELKVKLRATEKASGLAVLYFTATWCGPCRCIDQVISGFAEKYPKVVFLKVDIDEAPFVAAEYKPTLLPSFFFVRNGREIDNYLGVDMDLLQAKLAQNERIRICMFI